MDWMTTLQPMPELRPMFPVDPGDKSARAGFHVRRAGFGVWAVAYCRGGRLDEQYAAFKAWKTDPSGQATTLDSMAAAIVILIREWCPAVPTDWIVTAPPAGVSEGGPYPAGILGREVATRLGLDFQTCLERAKAKRWHHPAESRRQEPYRVTVAPPGPVIVIDDFISSGTTIRLAREAFTAAGVPSFAFCWGCD